MAQFFKIQTETLTQHALRKVAECKAVAQMAAETMDKAEDDREYANAVNARYEAEKQAVRWEELV